MKLSSSSVQDSRGQSDRSKKPKDKTSSEKTALSSLDKLGVADLVRFIIAITPLLDSEILLCVWPAKIPAEE